MRDLWRGVGAASLLAGALTLLLLLAGQVRQFWDVLRVAGPSLPIGRLAADTVLILAEAVAPILPLVACGLAFGRLRREQGLVALAALGVSPRRLLAPALALGGVAGLTTGAVAQAWAPPAAARLATTLVDGLLVAATGQAGAIRLPGGAIVAPDARGLWVALPDGPTVLRAERARVGADQLVFEGVHLWRPKVRASVRAAHVSLQRGAWRRRLKQFAAPNALRADALDLHNPHHRFTWHRRWAFAALAPLWALWGAVLGLGWRPVIGTIAGAGLVGGAYGLLRTGELTARAGLMSPALAAWAPALVLLGGLLLVLPRALRRISG